MLGLAAAMTTKPFDASLLDRWDFSVLEVDGFDEEGFIVKVGRAFFAHHDLIRSLNLSEERVMGFLYGVDSKYDRIRPYHSAPHAADVTINVNFLLQCGFARCVNSCTRCDVCT